MQNNFFLLFKKRMPRNKIPSLAINELLPFLWKKLNAQPRHGRPWAAIRLANEIVATGWAALNNARHRSSSINLEFGARHLITTFYFL